MILLAYAASRFVNIPPRELGLQLPGFYLAFQFNIHTFVALLVAGITATGADIMLRDHPGLENKRTWEHWLLPALTAWTLGIPLNQLPIGLQWLISFAIGGALLMLVLIAEYIAVSCLLRPPSYPGNRITLCRITLVLDFTRFNHSSRVG